MMKKKRTGLTSAIIWVLVTVILSGCSTTNDTETTATDNVNQTTAIPSAAMTPKDNTAATNPPNSSAPEVGNNSMQTADKKNAAKDRKSSPPADVPPPVIGSGAEDMFIFTQIRGALNADKNLAKAVTVEIKEGNVTLTGNVVNQDQKRK